MTNHDFKVRHDDHDEGGDLNDMYLQWVLQLFNDFRNGQTTQNDVNPNFLNNNDQNVKLQFICQKVSYQPCALLTNSRFMRLRSRRVTFTPKSSAASQIFRFTCSRNIYHQLKSTSKQSKCLMFRKHLLQSCEKLCAATKRRGSGQMTDLSGD